MILMVGEASSKGTSQPMEPGTSFAKNILSVAKQKGRVAKQLSNLN